jgi:hypothetical protein
MRRGLLALLLTLAMSGAVTASAAEKTTTTQKAVQPNVGSVWTGVASNGGHVRLKVEQFYQRGSKKVYRVPFLTWKKVNATCQRWNGTEFVESKEKITARLAPNSDDGAIRDGKFKWEYFYADKRIALFKGKFKRQEMQGTAQVFEYFFADPKEDGAKCKWGPLSLDLARSNPGHD